MSNKHKRTSRQKPPDRGTLWVAATAITILIVVGIVYGLQAATRSGSPPPASPTAANSETGNGNQDIVSRIGPEEASAMLAQGEAVLYDTRSLNSYAAKHAEGAISLPSDEVETRLASLPRDKTLIFY